MRARCAMFFAVLCVHALTPFTAEASDRVAFYGIFDPGRNPDLICSRAREGITGMRFVSGPKHSGPGALELDLHLDAVRATGRWIFPIPHVVLTKVSLWVLAPGPAGAAVDLRPVLLGGDRQTLFFPPVRIPASNDWRQVVLTVPDDVQRLANDPEFASIADATPQVLASRKYLLFSIEFTLAEDSQSSEWIGPVYLDELEFLRAGEGTE
jgi:hypothetical protein